MAFYIKGFKVFSEAIIQAAVYVLWHCVVSKVVMNVSKGTCCPHFHLQDVGDRLLWNIGDHQ
jgi:hypothetical protein